MNSAIITALGGINSGGQVLSNFLEGFFQFFIPDLFAQFT